MSDLVSGGVKIRNATSLSEFPEDPVSHRPRFWRLECSQEVKKKKASQVHQKH